MITHSKTTSSVIPESCFFQSWAGSRGHSTRSVAERGQRCALEWGNEMLVCRPIGHPHLYHHGCSATILGTLGNALSSVLAHTPLHYQGASLHLQTFGVLKSIRHEVCHHDLPGTFTTSPHKGRSLAPNTSALHGASWLVQARVRV
jgi:hypothetical protein